MRGLGVPSLSEGLCFRELILPDAGELVTSGQVNMQQIFTSDLYANSSQWNIKLGDPNTPGPLLTRAQMIDEGNMYPCAGVPPALSCLSNGNPT